jgi:membrane dipeptidase
MEHFSHLVAPCRTAADIEAAWAQHKTAALLTVENGSVLAGRLHRVEELAQDGVRILTLTWNGENEIGSGCATQHGLSPFGWAVIPKLEEQGILVDVSHLNDPCFFQVLERAQRPFVATHSNARAVCPHPRNLTDDQIREMVARRCLIGLNDCDFFLREGGGSGPDDLLRHVDHFLELGAEDCLALGSDFDGTDLPDFLQSPEQAAALFDLFLRHGLSPTLCHNILYGNALRFLRANLH